MPKKAWITVLFVTLTLTACNISGVKTPVATEPSPEPPITPSSTTEPTATEIPPKPTTTPSLTPTATEFAYDSPLREITILYTNDEHGYIEGVEEGRGAANMIGVWQERHDYSLDGPFLVLSGGDMWQWWGEAISSWYEGESMVEVMNGMGYDAAAVGNHEFDFGLAVLKERAAQMNFPLLSANLIYNNGSSIPEEFGISPYTILEVNGIRIGIIGLTTTSTHVKTINPAFEFEDYSDALFDVVPVVKAAGADLILVIGHVCLEELNALAYEIGSLGIHLLGGGHCHELSSSRVNETVIISGGWKLESYAYATFIVDIDADIVTVVDYGTEANQGGAAVPSIESTVAYWRGLTDNELNVPIGYIQNGLDKSSSSLNRLLPETWLLFFPDADIALSWTEIFQDSLMPGDIMISDVIRILPYPNNIVQLKMNGDELMRVLNNHSHEFVIGGLTQRSGHWVFRNTNEPIDPNEEYLVLVNDWFYAGSGDYPFSELDPDGYFTGIHERQPLINWIFAQDSSVDFPLDDDISDFLD